MDRLSSDYLYTYTQNFTTLKLMLENGFRHSLNKEKIPYKNSEQHNFIVCFCDILPSQSGYHRSVYGDYAISLKKEWGISNGISPLRYVHENSPGTSGNYIKIKNDMRIAREALHDGNQLDYFLSLLAFSKGRTQGLLTRDSIHDEIGNVQLDQFLGGIDDDFNEKTATLGQENLMNLFNDWIVPILHMLEKTIDEVERRDAFMRIYSDDFRGIENKVLYDEREWRSVKFLEEQDRDIYQEALTNEFLPPTFNLPFSTNDLYAIIVQDDNEKADIISFISTQPHLAGAENLVVTFDEHLKAIEDENNR